MSSTRCEGFVVALTGGRAVRTDVTDARDAQAPLQGADVAWVNVEVEDLARDALPIAETLGFSAGLMETLLEPALSAYEDRDVELGMRTPMVLKSRGLRMEPLLLLVAGNRVVTLYQRETATRFRQFARYAETAMRKLPPDMPRTDQLTSLLIRILDENNARNFDGIRPIQEQGEQLSAMLVQEDTDRKRLAHDIYRMKRVLISYLDALWASLDVIYSLQHGDAELVTDDETMLARVALLGDDVQRHIQISEHMSEVLSSGLEVMQSIYNNQLTALNNRFAFIVTWLTVLGTAVLVPNTLATVLGAAPPGLRVENPFAYLALMVGSTAVATAVAWLWVRTRVPVPRKLD